MLFGSNVLFDIQLKEKKKNSIKCKKKKYVQVVFRIDTIFI